MKMHTVAVAVAISAVPLTVSAQTVDQLVADHALLNAELDRCKQLGMASVGDTRCKAAWSAESKRFFGNGRTIYTPLPVTVTPGEPVPDITAHARKLGAPNGQ